MNDTWAVGIIQVVFGLIGVYWGVYLQRRQATVATDNQASPSIEPLTYDAPPFVGVILRCSLWGLGFLLILLAYSGYRLEEKFNSTTVIQFGFSGLLVLADMILMLTAKLVQRSHEHSQYIRTLFNLNSAEVFILRALMESEEVSPAHRELLKSLVKKAMEASRVNDYHAWIESQKD